MAGRSRSKDKGRTQQEYAVIGLGGFGGTLARRLEAMGHMVLGVDSNVARVQDIADEITSAVALDATIEDALQEVDITAFDTVVVALGHAFEASALVTSYLKEVGIRRVICTTETRRHQKILLRIGAPHGGREREERDGPGGGEVPQRVALPGAVRRAQRQVLGGGEEPHRHPGEVQPQAGPEQRRAGGAAPAGEEHLGRQGGEEQGDAGPHTASGLMETGYGTGPSSRPGVTQKSKGRDTAYHGPK